jgi:hypothetical protein
VDGEAFDGRASGGFGCWFATNFGGQRGLDLEAIGGLLWRCPMEDNIVASAHGSKVGDEAGQLQ